MSEPRRLLDGDGGDLERSLLGAARADAPPAGSRRKALVALGLGAGVLGAGTTVTTATAASTALLKWIGLGVVSGALVVGAVSVAHQGAPPAASAHVAATPSPVVPRAAPQPEALDPAPVAAPTEDPVPALSASAARVEAPRPRASADHPEHADHTALADEIAVLDEAREALGAGNGAGAIAALDRHDREFARGLLGPEATVMRIEALSLRGDRAGAARLGEAFLASHPRSPAAHHVRTLIGATGEGGNGP